MSFGFALISDFPASLKPAASICPINHFLRQIALLRTLLRNSIRPRAVLLDAENTFGLEHSVRRGKPRVERSVHHVAVQSTHGKHEVRGPFTPSEGSLSSTTSACTLPYASGEWSRNAISRWP